MRTEGNGGIERAASVADEFMRIDIKVSPRLVEEIARLAEKNRVPVGRMAAMLLAKATHLSEEEALPPFKPAGRPRRRAVPA